MTTREAARALALGPHEQWNNRRESVV